MNKLRRKWIEKVVDALTESLGEIESIQSEEEEYRDNIPENLQESERYERADEACENLEAAYNSLEEAIDYLNESME